jgi:hypothetical protein
MKGTMRRATTVVGGVAVLALTSLSFATPAVAATPAGTAAAVTGEVSFPQAVFSGYSSGDEAHVNALAVTGATDLANVTQAFSGASTNTAGLATAITGDDGGVAGTGLQVQPAKSATNDAYGAGVGLTAGLGAAADGSGNQLNLANGASQVAPPDAAEQTATLLPSQVSTLPSGLGTLGVLDSRGDAYYDPNGCPIGQPISYGEGDAADVSLLNFSGLSSGAGALSGLLGSLGSLPGGATIPGLPTGGLTLPATGSLISTAGTGTATAESDSETFLSQNPDGTYGLTTQSRETIAPVTVNLFGQATLQLTVSGATPNSPVTLDAVTTGESSGAQVTLGADDIVQVALTAGGMTTNLLPADTSLATIVGKGGFTLDLNPTTLITQLGQEITNLNLPGLPAGTLTPVTGPLATLLGTIGSAGGGAAAATPLDLSLGSISIGTPVRAINGAVGTAPTQTGGTVASGAFDLARIHLGISDPGTPAINSAIPAQLSDIADVNVGHLEAAASLAAPINCALPVVKTADPTSVTAGQSFDYTIQIPSPTQLADIACNLSNVSATDTISVLSGTPTFVVTGVSDGGTATKNADGTTTVNWSGLSYTVAPLGSPPNQPITLTITVAVPAGSAAGQLQDLVTATGTPTSCNGGASGIAGLGQATTPATLSGSYTLQQPTVTGGVGVAASSTPAVAASTLPFTGGPGGLWQPVAGLVALGAGAGALGLVRRSRRRSQR